MTTTTIIRQETPHHLRHVIFVRSSYFVLGLIFLLPVLSAFAGRLLGAGVLHPANLNPMRLSQTEGMLIRTGATKENFSARAPDGVELRGWKVRAQSPNGDWVLLFHGVSDNRTGDLGHAELLLRHGYNVVMMDSRAHG